MKRIVMVTVIVASAVLLLLACGKDGGASEANKQLMDEFAELTDATAEKLEQAESGDAAADVLDGYAKSVRTVMQKGQEISKKYPDYDPREDESTQENQQAFAKAQQRFRQSIQNAIQKYQDNEKFQKALQKFGRGMQQQPKAPQK